MWVVWDSFLCRTLAVIRILYLLTVFPIRIKTVFLIRSLLAKRVCPIEKWNLLKNCLWMSELRRDLKQIKMLLCLSLSRLGKRLRLKWWKRVRIAWRIRLRWKLKEQKTRLGLKKAQMILFRASLRYLFLRRAEWGLKFRKKCRKMSFQWSFLSWSAFLCSMDLLGLVQLQSTINLKMHWCTLLITSLVLTSWWLTNSCQQQLNNFWILFFILVWVRVR